MSRESLGYDRLVENALRGVVRDALRQVETEGLRGAQHFYISFRSAHPGVRLADHLQAEHPDEMTIVLQHQFWGLEVGDEAFEVTLSFKGAQERLCVPFAAITTFADPSVEWGLQLKAAGHPAAAAETKLPEEAPEAGAAHDKKKEGGQVVALDAFRSK